MQSVIIAFLECQNRLLEVMLLLERVESRMAKELSIYRNSGSGAAERQITSERQRLGHQLHTGVGQLLVAIRIQGDIIRKRAPDFAAAVNEELRRIDQLAHGALEEVRGISKEIYAPEWQKLPLHAALQELWEKSGVSRRFAASMNTRPLAVEPNQRVKTLLYRAAQEGISNLVRHAKATRVHLSLTSAERWIGLTVKDDGVGFDTARLLESSTNAVSGIGLRALRQEAADLGGRLTIWSGPQGTTLRVLMPSGEIEVESAPNRS